MKKEFKDLFKGQSLKRHFLSGLSFMIPVIIMSD